MAIIYFFLRLFFGGVFIYSGVQKVIDPFYFQTAIESYQMTSVFLSQILAFFIPTIEVIVGLMLVLGLWLKVAWLLYFGLMMIIGLSQIMQKKCQQTFEKNNQSQPVKEIFAH